MNVLAKILICALGMTLTGCGRRASNVHFILPDGYRGVFRIKSDPKGPAVTRRDDGAFVYLIPSAGSLITSTTKPLLSVESVTGEFRSGQQIPWNRLGRNAQPSKPPGIYNLHADSDGWFYFFLGTYDDLKAIIDEPRLTSQVGGATNSLEHDPSSPRP
jgi:hypothetical protein